MSRRTAIFLLFTSAYFMSYFYRSANAVIAKDLAAEMGLAAAQLGLMTSLFFAAFAAMQLPLGIGLDRWGPRWVTPGLMLAAVAGSFVFAVAASFGQLALGRALMGLGMAGVLMGSLKIFSQWYPAERFATVSGLLVGIGSLGALLAATPMAWLNQSIGWRAVFFVGAMATALIAVAIMYWARNTPHGVDWHGSGPSGRQGTLREIVADARIWRIVPMTFFMAGVVLGFQGLWAGPYLMDVMKLDEVQAGNILLLMAIGATAGYGASGWLVDRFGIGRVILVSALLFAVCQLGLALQPPLVLVSLLYLMFGFSGGFNVMLMAHARRIFPLSMTGKAVTVVNLFAIGGTFLLQWWYGVVIGVFPPVADGVYAAQGFSLALTLTAVGTLIAAAWYYPLAKDSVSQPSSIPEAPQGVG